jgi:hypothetical protein
MVGNCGSGAIVIPPGTPPNLHTAETELENCDRNNDTFLDGLMNLSNWSYNDDYLVYGILRNTDTWTYTGEITDSNNNQTGQVSNVNVGNVGIGTDTPQYNLTVNGVIEASQDVQASNIYDPSTPAINPMKPEAIGGQISDMSCDPTQPQQASGVGFGPGTAVTGIAYNQVICTQIFPNIPLNACPPGMHAYGISSTLGLLCR